MLRTMRGYYQMGKEYFDISEEELKTKVREDYFPKSKFDYHTIGKIDCAIADKKNNQCYLWAEAKKGSADYITSLVQLILTIGRARTFDKECPPAYLGAFDAEKIAFLPYHVIHPLFGVSDLNWNVTPSDHGTKEFLKIKKVLVEYFKFPKVTKPVIYRYKENSESLKDFIKTEFVHSGNENNTKLFIDKNNFINVYNKWRNSVKDTINVRWDLAKKAGIIDADFYLADLLSEKNKTLKEKLFVLLKSDHYELSRKTDDFGMFSSSTATFNDQQAAHTQFWERYKRPPASEYWNYIIERRDLLVPQDVRERKGSFFTPQIWVEKSQEYLADVLGENWQEEYTIWDCAAGTGNLLNGLTNKYNVWASTLDRADVDVMLDRIKNGANLLESHVFQFDFLNDDFSKLPSELQKIINDPKKRKKLLIYINPPYAEATSATTVTGTGANKSKVATENKTYLKYKSLIGKASNEIFAQFFIRIYCEIPGCILGEFSKLKVLSASNFANFRSVFTSKLERAFIVPAYSFDNVKGQFPIGFFIWDTGGNVNYPTFNRRVNPSVDLKGCVYEANGERMIADNNSPLGRGAGEAGGVGSSEYLTFDGHIIQKKPFVPPSADPVLLKYAVQNRSAGNLSEAILWSHLRSKKFYGLDFDRQRVIYNYIVDFFVVELGLVIEIDGCSHLYKGDNDVVRQQFLENLGLHIIRLSDSDVRYNTDKVLEYIKLYILENYKVIKEVADNSSPHDGIMKNPPRQSSTATPPERGMKNPWDDPLPLADVYDENGKNIGKKKLICDDENSQSINKWIKIFDDKNKRGVGLLGNPSPDFQHNSQMYLSIIEGIEHFNFWNFSKNNLIQGCIYFTVRQCIPATWLNDRDQFLFPTSGWKTDYEFQGDCLAFALFHGQNRISHAEGTNHWIPFTESEVGSREKFESNFMSKFIKSFLKNEVTIQASSQASMFADEKVKKESVKFSREALAVFGAGLDLWKYYHEQPKKIDVNASLYDIRAYFQGRNDKTGRMKVKSEDEQYNELINKLRTELDALAKKIEPKVYKYGFLK